MNGKRKNESWTHRLRARTCILAALGLLTSPVQAAFLFEIDTDGLDDGSFTQNPRFSFGGDTTTASTSAASLAYGVTGADSIFGGDGIEEPDTYVYRYAPDSEADNLIIPAGTDLGEGNLATGETGGGTGLYNVYATWPYTENVSGGDTEFAVSTAGDSFTIQVDQNGKGNNWIYLGQIDYSSGDITVEQYPTVQNSFISQRAYGLLFEAVDDGIANDTARFAVSVAYSDGNTAAVNVMLSCNNGLPLEQDFSISDGSPVEFILTDFTPGEADCTVSASGGVDGYAVSFDNGSEISGSGCVFTDIAPGEYACTLTNTLEQVTYTINKQWLFSEEEDGIKQQVSLEVTCENFRLGPDGILDSGSEAGEIGVEQSTISFDIYPNWTTPETRCQAVETQIVSGVESDQGCADWLILTPGGAEQSCTITNTVFFEGIPTLNRTGLALLVLLMMGVGFVVLRRLN